MGPLDAMSPIAAELKRPPAPPLEAVSLWFEATLATPDHGLNFTGAPLRGVFGLVLKDLVCIRPAPRICETCSLQRACPYPRIFDGLPRPGVGHAASGASVQQPFLLEVAPPSTWWGEPDCLEWGVLLLGDAANWAPYLIEAFDRAGEQGIGPARVPYRIDRISDATNECSMRSGSDEHLGLPDRADVRNREAPSDGVLRLSFETPLDLRLRDRPVSDLLPIDLILAGRRRWRALVEHHGRPDLLLADAHVDADAFAFRRVDLHPWGFDRFSRRQQQRMRMQGLIGSVDIDGPWSLAGEWVRAVETIHLGKHTTFGFGRVRWEQIA